MTKRLSEKKTAKCLRFYCLVIPKGDLTTKKTKPESIGVDISNVGYCQLRNKAGERAVVRAPECH